MSAEARIPLTSTAPNADRLAELQSLFPEAFTEGKVDFERLKQALGESIQTDRERYGLNWAGKSDAIHALQSLSVGTLQPQREESVNFDTTENLIIEGDNLEVLKLLQKSYFGKVKMIYIDPPYNTGNEFIYPDNFREGLEDYLRFSGQMSVEGTATTSNKDMDGRYHSKWLSMMYPRLFLAKNLLSSDGVIFISIDDNEASNLKLMCDEIFGEENYLVTLYLQVRYAGKTLAEKNDYQKLIEQVLVYQKQEFIPNKEESEYTIEKFCWEIEETGQGRTETISGKHVHIFGPGEYTIRRVAASVDALKETWATGTVAKANASGKFLNDNLAPRKAIDGVGCLYKVDGIGEDGLGYRYFTGPKKSSAEKGKFYSGVPIIRREAVKASSATKQNPILNWYNYADAFGNCRHEGGIPFGSGKKPIALLKRLLKISTDNDHADIVLDFFAGSGSLGHAVLDLNKEDKGNRRFILVQLPETVEDAGYKTISDMTKQRIRNISDPHDEFSGFKSFRLAASNFKIWNDQAEAADQDALTRQLDLFADNLLPDATPENILFEILLKAGYDLNVPREEITVAGQPVQSIADGSLLVCLERSLSRAVVDGLIARAPSSVICLDEAFHGDDALLTNTVLQMQDAGIVFQTI